jgi:hypothetical protein
MWRVSRTASQKAAAMDVMWAEHWGSRWVVEMAGMTGDYLDEQSVS